MTEKIGRNDPCPCGSGKKYKQCCLLKKGGGGIKRKLAAVWVNKPVKEGVNLMDRTFGSAISDLSASPPSFLTTHSITAGLPTGSAGNGEANSSDSAPNENPEDKAGSDSSKE